MYQARHIRIQPGGQAYQWTSAENSLQPVQNRKGHIKLVRHDHVATAHTLAWLITCEGNV